MKVVLFGFLKNSNNKLFLPSLNIFIVFLFIILNPFLKIGAIQFWMFAPFILLLLNYRLLRNELALIKNFVPLLIYVSIHFFISLIIHPNYTGSILKFFLFFLIYISFLILLAKSYSFPTNKDLFEKIINILVLIICIYGIYQFVGRQLNWPFTLNEILRFRGWKVGGFYQISSFFEEPAYLSQFLVIMLFIQLFFFEAKNIKIIVLIVINLIFSISVTGIITLVFIILFYFLRKFKIRITHILTKRHFFIYTSISLVIIVTTVIILNSNVGSYIGRRLQNTFITKEIKHDLEQQQKLKGGSVSYDKSGYRRIVNEMITLKEIVFSKRVLFGYGIYYQKQIPERIMGLNAITEFFVRWGLIGFLLFIIPVYSTIRNNINQNYILAFLVIYFFIDGAIAKLSFWFLLSLILIAARIYSDYNLLKEKENVIHNSPSS